MPDFIVNYVKKFAEDQVKKTYFPLLEDIFGDLF